MTGLLCSILYSDNSQDFFKQWTLPREKTVISITLRINTHSWDGSYYFHRFQEPPCSSGAILADASPKSQLTCKPFFFFFWLRSVTCGVLDPLPGMEHVVEAWSPSHWTSGEALTCKSCINLPWDLKVTQNFIVSHSPKYFPHVHSRDLNWSPFFYSLQTRISLPFHPNSCLIPLGLI